LNNLLKLKNSKEEELLSQIKKLEDERDECLFTIEEQLDKEMQLSNQVTELEENSVWL